MVITKYPEEVEKMLHELDKQIAKIYEEETPPNTAVGLSYETIKLVKRTIYERTKPLIERKVEIIKNSVPKYILKYE